MIGFVYKLHKVTSVIIEAMIYIMFTY